jgi:hypothetical protein
MRGLPGGGFLMLEREQEYYETHKEGLREKYAGMEVVISGETILGVYDSVEKAYEEAKKALPPGSFLMKSIPVYPEEEIIALSPFTYG